jgi:hypothetical protein
VGARGFQPWCAHARAPLEHPDHPGEAIEDRIGQQRLHEVHGRWADLGRERLAALAGPERAEDLLGGHMIEMSHPRAGTRGTRVRGHQLVARGLESDLLAATPDPQRLANQAKRGRGEGRLQDRGAIALACDRLPQGQVIGHRGQGLERGALDCLEALERRLLGRPLDPRPRGRQAPGPDLHLGLRQQRGHPAPQNVPCDVVDAALLDCALVFGGAWAAWGPQKAIVLGTLPRGALDLGVVEAGLHDARLQVVEDDPRGHAPEAAERMAMELNPRRQDLIKDKLHILMPAICQDHHEGTGLAERPGDGIEHAARIAKIHLGFAAGLTFHPYGGRRALRLASVENAIERGQSARVAALV